MINLAADFAIVGSGFGGSLSALLLERIGLSSVLIERGSHPRVVLGESSTPAADLVLQSLAARYDLPRIAPLAKWGPWQRAYPEMTCGLKRGFSYFRHKSGEPFEPRRDHANELLVAASIDDETSDTQWYRPEFDLFLVREAQGAGIPFLDRTQITRIADERPWRLVGEREGEPVEIRAEFVLDASGEGQFLSRHLALPASKRTLRTNSRCLYGHFHGVKLWDEMLAARGARLDEQPYGNDHATVHHIIDGGWMFVIRFNNGITSAGFLLDCDRHPLDPAVSAADEWSALLREYPSIAEQFADAELVGQFGPLRRTPRLQRRAECSIGPNWAQLPLTAYALDALHSTGNAHTLTGIERLMRTFERKLPVDERHAALKEYDRILQREIDLVDDIVSGCYAAFDQFELFTSFSMFYFAGATTSEMNRRRGRYAPGHAFLLAHDENFCRVVREARESLCGLLGAPPGRRDAASFMSWIGQLVAPFNVAGLCDPSRKNHYPYLELAE